MRGSCFSDTQVHINQAMRQERFWIDPEYRPILHDNHLRSFDDLMQAEGCFQLRKRKLAGWRQRVVLALQTANGQANFYIKRYHRPPLAQQIKRLLRWRAGTAEVELYWIQRLLELGFRVPKVVAYGSRGSRAWETESFLLTAELPGQSLEGWIPQGLRIGQLEPGSKNECSVQLAALVARLHRAGLAHRDLYASHIFVEPLADGRLQLSLLDLQRVCRPIWLKRQRMIKDLAALNYSIPIRAATLTDRLRWFRRYRAAAAHQNNQLLPGDRKLIASIAAKSRRIARHSRKHGLG